LKILFDEGVPLPLRQHFLEDSVQTVQALGWSGKTDHEIIRLAEAARYDCLLTTDKNILHQQNTAAVRIEIHVLATTSWPKLQPTASTVVSEVKARWRNREHPGHDKVDE